LQPNRAVAIEDDKFFEALDDDLNISAALGHLFEQIRESNRELDGGIDSARALAWFTWWAADQPGPRARSGAGRATGGNCADGGGTEARASLPETGKKVMNCATHSRRGGWEVRDTKDWPGSSPAAPGA
jgi:hypothetical protein